MENYENENDPGFGQESTDPGMGAYSGAGENPYAQNPYSQAGYAQPDYPQGANGNVYVKEAKKGPGFGLGIVLGILAGALITGIGVFAGFTLYARTTGSVVTMGQDGAVAVSDSELLDEDFTDKVEELLAYVEYYYTGEVDIEEMQNEMLHSLVDSLGDPYSVYYDEAEYADMQITTTGEYYGIGAGLSQALDTMEVTISKVYSGTPAEEAGLLKGDQILYVEDIDATTMELSDLVTHIRGEAGTSVHLQILRDEEVLEFDVERRNVVLPSVEGQMLDNDMGYIIISEWQTNTPDQFTEYYEKLEAEGMKGLIVDVRSNPGGLLTSVVSVLDYLLPEGTVVYCEDKYGNRQDYTSDASCKDIPMVVLVDGSSASASEIFAGAMKDYEAATLVGTTTFGKGIVQSMFSLEDNDAIKVTTAKYYTPAGNYIHEVGIDPDVELEYEWLGPEDATVYDMQYDNQLQKAIEVLGELMSE